jgi:uncharacterized membrane protein
MSEHNPQPASERERQFEQLLGNLLRGGVLLAAVVVLTGGVVYLARHGSEPPDRNVFHGEPADLRQPVAIVERALQPSGQGIIQLGLLLLVATPVARVVFSVAGFARERDAIYVVLTLIVLAVLLCSLFSTGV